MSSRGGSWRACATSASSPSPRSTRASPSCCEILNTRPMRLYRASRRELFERLDRPALRPLPAEAFIVGEWNYDARVNIDYHVELHGHYYSVPHPLSHELVDARLTVTTVELFHRGQRVAAHVRSHLRGRHTTDPAHMPKAHQHHLEWTPVALHHLGRHHRPADRRPRRGHPRRPAAPRAGLPLVPRHLAPRQTLRPRPARGRLCPRRRRRRALLPACRLHPQTWPRPAARAEAPPPLPLMPAHEQIRGREYYQDPAAPAAPAAAGEQAR